MTPTVASWTGRGPRAARGHLFPRGSHGETPPACGVVAQPVAFRVAVRVVFAVAVRVAQRQPRAAATAGHRGRPLPAGYSRWDADTSPPDGGEVLFRPIRRRARPGSPHRHRPPPYVTEMTYAASRSTEHGSLSSRPRQKCQRHSTTDPHTYASRPNGTRRRAPGARPGARSCRVFDS
jgi:hypothetical protein